jgi:hypothetical protein
MKLMTNLLIFTPITIGLVSGSATLTNYRIMVAVKKRTIE